MCDEVGTILIIFLVLLSFALLDAVEEEVLDLCLLRVVKSLVVAQLLIRLLHGLHLLLKNQNVHVSRAIVRLEKLEDTLHGFVLGQITAHE